MRNPFPDLELIRRRLDGRIPLTRFAPSPTGYLHVGHVVNAIYVWGIARALGGKVILRLEDHDRQRSRPEYEAAIHEDLAWLGLEADLGRPDELAAPSRYRQSDRTTAYEEGLRILRERGHVYACDCSRRILKARTTGTDHGELRYDGFCRDRNLDYGPKTGLRIQLPADTLEFDDLLAGPQSQTPAQQCGDLLIMDRNDQWTYQYAVVYDDVDMGANLIIRGMDILPSTGRQLLLGRYWDPDFDPLFLHHPLLMNEKGKKLSKRNFDADIHQEHLEGVAPEIVIGRAAKMVGLLEEERPVAADELADLVAGK